MSWKRLEAAAIDPQLAEGLEARVADPLWMLARQWQTGEFRGEDAANPLLVKMKSSSTRFDRVIMGGGETLPVEKIEVPLEPLVEREPVRTGPGAAWVAAELGRLLVRVLQRGGIPPSLVDALRVAYPVTVPPDRGLDPAGRRRLHLLARRSIDGVTFAAALEADPTLLDPIYDQLKLDTQTRTRATTAVEAWQALTREVFSEPGDATTWDPQRMEYRFELRAARKEGDIRLVADGYSGGRLEWYHFDRHAAGPNGVTPLLTIEREAEVLPAPLRFRGMPAARFWEFEEGDVYFGGIEAAPEDLARVAVATYGLYYGDDWLVLPLRIPLGTVTQVTELSILDDFGTVTTIPAAAVVDGGRQNRAFRFFELSGDRGPEKGEAPFLFLPPTVETTDAGRPLEDIRFVRDEVANVAWAVERRIESPSGRPVDLAARRSSPAPTPSDDGDDWRFVLSTEVPDNWIPLVPVRFEDEAIMFQRGRMPVADKPGTTRGALGRVLMPTQRLLIHEEEIPREGIRVVRRFQSARAADGKLHTWVGRRKGPGRGEGHSGHVFDNLERTT